tara:strand:+ start:21 stop:200 length:180 start_codon:yes stop_codon:yes gene_type:complete
MNYFDLLDNDLILKIIKLNIKIIENEIEKLEKLVKDVEKYWYYETDYDSNYNLNLDYIL